MKTKKILSLLTITVIMLIAFSSLVVGEVYLQNENHHVEIAYAYNSENVVMLPLLDVAESLGYIVLQEQEMIIVGYGFQLWIGESHYRVGMSGEIILSAAPEIIDGDVFVPIDFVRYALGYEAQISNGTVVIGENLTSTVWIAHNATNAWFSGDSDYEYSNDLTQIGFGRTQLGGEVFSLIRMSLRGDWFADEVAEARLFLKAVEGTPPSNVYVGTVANSWGSSLERTPARDILHENSLALTEVRQETNDWFSLDVTDIVVSWLAGEIPNRGFALFPTNEEAVGVFLSGMSAPIGHAPRIVVSAEIGERSTDFGRFGYTVQPRQGAIEPMDGGNCFSYALRDLDGIYYQQLQFDFDEINRLFFESGPNGVLGYLIGYFVNYVETHGDALQISGFRRIENFDSPIDVEREYRIALRVAAYATEALPMNERYGFDFHFWMQLNDGRWAQTSPAIFSEIVPGTGPGIDPAAFLWDGATTIWMERYQEWYNSDVAYFAVTKDTDEFTRHRTAVSPDIPLGQTTHTTGEIVVNGQTISAPAPSVSSGVIMLPLREIAEALDFTVTWNGIERLVNIGENYVVWIDRPMISRDGGQTTQEFGPPSIIIDGSTFVPLPFFNFGMSGTSARIVDGVVVVEWNE